MNLFVNGYTAIQHIHFQDTCLHKAIWMIKIELNLLPVPSSFIWKYFEYQRQCLKSVSYLAE